jgi:hypothetical protein
MVVIPGISGSSFPQHIFDCTPLREQELVLDLVGVNRECSFVGKHHDSLPNPGREELSRWSGNIDVRGRPVQQEFGRTGSMRDSIHQRCQSEMVLGRGRLTGRLFIYNSY